MADIEKELRTLRVLWETTCVPMALMAEDTTTAIVPKCEYGHEKGSWSKVEMAAKRLSTRGRISVRTQRTDTGEHFLIPLFVEKEESLRAIIELLPRIVSFKQQPTYGSIYRCGYWMMGYESGFMVAIWAKIENIPSAPMMINAFVEWVSEKIGAKVTTSDTIGLDGNIVASMDRNWRIGLSEIQSLTGVRYDDQEEPTPPIWASEINMTREPDSADTFAYIGDVPIVQRNGITLISGAAKSGKTVLVSSMIASIIGRNTVLGISPGRDGRILWADTEQSQNDIAIVRKRIEAMAGKRMSDADIKGVHLRPFGPEQSTAIIEEKLKQLLPDILLIDGPGDLCSDTNDISSSQATVKTLLRWADEYNCAVVGVVHTNPNSEKTRGHIGSEIERKCAFSLLTFKDESDPENTTFKVKPGFMRGKRFPAYNFRYGENGIPEITEVTNNAPMTVMDRIYKSMEPGVEYKSDELVQKAVDMGIEERKARSAVSNLAKSPKIIKSQFGSLSLRGDR